MLAKTPLHEQHIKLGAKMLDFHGWEMPLHYGSQINEHHMVRRDAGMFDVSHMTVVDLLGAGGRQFLRKLLTNDVDNLKHSGKALYTCMCNETGGIIDDLIVYQRAPDNYRLVLNSATKARDLAWIREKSAGFAVGLQERSDLAIIAIQGPHARAKTLDVLNNIQADAISTLAPFECVDIDSWFFARTGYTGEDGLEIILPHAEAQTLWSALYDKGIAPCGLASRDTLRLEAGLLLYGQDMDEHSTPLESGLNWVVKWVPEDRDFIGMGALLSHKRQGIEQKFVGLILEEKGIMRHGQRLVIEGLADGIITSGGFSPSLNCSIALARVPMATGEQVLVEIRGKYHSAKVGPARFVKHGVAL